MHAAHHNDPWTRAEPVRKPRVKNRRRARATARGNVLPGPRTDNLWRNDERSIYKRESIFVYIQSATFDFVLVSARVYRSNNTFQLFTRLYLIYGNYYQEMDETKICAIRLFIGKFLLFKKSIISNLFFFNFSKKSFKKIEGEGMRIAFKKSIL